MKFKYLLTILISIILVFGFLVYARATELQSPMSLYHDNFFLFGDEANQTKFQVSAKYNLLWPFDSGIYVAYSQLTHWYVYGDRDTMHSAYQPEVLYRFTSGDNPFNNFKIPFVDYIQAAPEYHCSTGVEGVDHRAVNEYYGQIQMSVGEIYNFGFNARMFGYYTICDKNKDINEYQKNYQADIFFKLQSGNVLGLDKEELHCTFSGDPLNKGFIEVKFIVRLFTTYIQPHLFLDYYRGYLQDMVTYNQKDNVIRIGIDFTN